MRSQPLVCVTDVEASSRWYQRLLRCRGAHGGSHYEQLVKDGSLILQLHSFDVEHHHGPIGNPADRPTAMVCCTGSRWMTSTHPKHWECWMRDPDGYTVVIASPYGTADGAWRPGPDLFT